MKEPSNLNKQHGAVLAFSLLMLLLLTLAGIRMIQQNKQQLEMANNMRLVTQSFANAESFVNDAKKKLNGEKDENGYILMPQHIDQTIDPRTNKAVAVNDPQHQCVPTDTFEQNIGLAGEIIYPTQVILSVSCWGVPNPVTQNVVIQECSTYDETTRTVTCHPHPSGASHSSDFQCDNSSLNNVISKFTNPTNICYQAYDPQADNPALNAPIVKGKCPKEVYKIKADFTDEYGTTRTIISDHAVGCGS